jgi:hypothetical protein
MQYVTRQEASQFQYQASGPERLAALATFLGALPPNRLTLCFWFKNNRGCAVGLAAATGVWFQAQGLRLKDIDRPALCRPVYQEMSDWDAVSAFFDLSNQEGQELFSAAAYNRVPQPPPSLIAARIRRHLATSTRRTALSD